MLLAFCPLFAALYPLTQLYQLDEDARRGDRTLASSARHPRSLDAAIVAATAIAFLCFAAAGAAGGWRIPADGWRWLALAGAALGGRGAGAVAAGLPAARRRPSISEGMYRALGAWAVTDAGGGARPGG